MPSRRTPEAPGEPGLLKTPQKSLKGKKACIDLPAVCPGPGARSFCFHWGTSWSSLRIQEMTFRAQVLFFLILELFIASIGPSHTLK